MVVRHCRNGIVDYDIEYKGTCDRPWLSRTYHAGDHHNSRRHCSFASRMYVSIMKFHHMTTEECETSYLSITQSFTLLGPTSVLCIMCIGCCYHIVSSSSVYYYLSRHHHSLPTLQWLPSVVVQASRTERTYENHWQKILGFSAWEWKGFTMFARYTQDITKQSVVVSKICPHHVVYKVVTPEIWILDSYV